jgi:hypothetical protein
MSKGLEQRIDQLEREAGITGTCMPTIIVSFPGWKDGKRVDSGALIGYRVNDKLVGRLPSEAEAAFTERVIAENRPQWPNGLVLIESRGEGSSRRGDQGSFDSDVAM